MHTGDVSQPGAVVMGGVQGFDPQFDPDTLEFHGGVHTPANRCVAGIQAFVGMSSGSPELSALAGMPISLPGFTLDRMASVAAIDGLVIDDVVRFTNGLVSTPALVPCDESSASS